MDMDWGGYLRFLMALVFVLGLIALCATLARRAGWGFPVSAIKKTDGRRLGVVEVTQLDGRRRMILVRRDQTEHLLLISPTAEIVIESGITRGHDQPSTEKRGIYALAPDHQKIEAHASKPTPGDDNQ